MLKVVFDSRENKKITSAAEIYVCNLIERKKDAYDCQLDVEDFHIAYMNGKRFDDGFSYKHQLEMECKFIISNCFDDEISVVCHTDYARTRFSSPFFYIGVAPANYFNDVKSAYKTAYNLVYEMKNVKTAFIFNTDMAVNLLFAVICKNGEIISKENLYSNIDDIPHKVSGEIYLVVLQAEKTQVYNVSDFKLF